MVWDWILFAAIGIGFLVLWLVVLPRLGVPT